MPILYIFAGVNGAGKSTLTKSQCNKVIPYEINADEISRRNGRDWQDICLLYVGLSSAELAIERVKIRVANGGHGVRKEMIKKRYDRSLNTLYELIRKVDSVSIYDNSGDSLIRIYQRIDNKHFMTSELPNRSSKIIAHEN